MIRKFVTLTTIAGTDTIIPVDLITAIDEVIMENGEPRMPYSNEQDAKFRTCVKFETETMQCERFVNQTPKQVLDLIKIA